MAIYEVEDPKSGAIYEIEAEQLPSAQNLTELISAYQITEPKDQKTSTPSFFGGGKSRRGSGGGADIPLNPIYEQLDVEQNPVLGTVQDVAGQAGIGSAQGLTGRAFGALLKKGGESLPEPATTAGKVARVGTEVVGSVAGLTGKAALMAGKYVAGKTASKIAQFGAAGVAGGFTITPESETGDMVQFGQRLKNGLISGTIGAGIGVAYRTGQIIKNVAAQSKFADSVKAEFQHVMNQANAKFGGTIDKLTSLYPSKRVDLTDAVKNAQDMLDDSPGLRTTIKKFPKLKAIFEDPSKAKNLTLKDAQDLKNSIKYVTQPRPEDLPINDLRNAISKAQVDTFPQFDKTLGEYKQVAEDYDLISKMLQDGKIIGAVKKGFGDAQVKDAVTRTFGKEMVAEMGGVKNAANVGKAAWKLGKFYVMYRFFRGALGRAAGGPER